MLIIAQLGHPRLGAEIIKKTARHGDTAKGRRGDKVVHCSLLFLVDALFHY